MKSQDDLHALYAEWRRLTEAEKTAIERSQWAKLHQYQAQKQELQACLLQATECWRAGGADPARCQAEYERQFRPVVDELILLETRNHEMLRCRHEKCRAELEGLGAAARQLRELHRAYAPQRPSWWSSYS